MIINKKLVTQMAKIKMRKNVSKKSVWEESISYEIIYIYKLNMYLGSWILIIDYWDY